MREDRLLVTGALCARATALAGESELGRAATMASVRVQSQLDVVYSAGPSFRLPF